MPRGYNEYPEKSLADALTAAKKTVSTAESCTGGLIAKRITDVPGSSAVFPGGAVTYTNEIKMRLLGVSALSIQRYTEVSHAVAAEMARGARLAFGSDFALSTTGCAGPGGGTAEDPVGTVYIGLSTPEGERTVRLCCGEDRTRDEVRTMAADYALQMLLDIL
jgi:PncC family amidohydrolase